MSTSISDRSKEARFKVLCVFKTHQPASYCRFSIITMSAYLKPLYLLAGKLDIDGHALNNARILAEGNIPLVIVLIEPCDLADWGWIGRDGLGESECGGGYVGMEWISNSPRDLQLCRE
jgi:hypothetical protein